MHAAPALASAAAKSGFDVVEPEQAYARVGDTLGLSSLYATVPITSADPHWDQLAKAALRDELSALTIAIARDALAAGRVTRWARQEEDALARARAAYAGLAGSGDVDVAKLTVASRCSGTCVTRLEPERTAHPSVAGTTML